MQFLDLPLELLPEIVQCIVKPHHLAQLCLVNKTFHLFAAPRLYERVYIYSWHREGKNKACRVFYDNGPTWVNLLKSGYQTV